jgi:hypothetical protein
MYRKSFPLFMAFIGFGWLLSVTLLHAETCTGTTCTYTAAGTEPTTKVGGAPLDNLKQIVLTPKLNGAVQAPITIPATKPSGGGAFTKGLTITPTPCAITTLSVDAQAENTLGAKSTAVTQAKSKDLTLDPTCAPVGPGAFTLD